MNMSAVIYDAGTSFACICCVLLCAVIVLVIRANRRMRDPKEVERQLFNLSVNAEVLEELSTWLSYHLSVYHQTGSHLSRDDARERIRRIRELLSICEQQMAEQEKERGL